MIDLTRPLGELLPRKVADALAAAGGTEFIADMTRRYLEADEASRADIRAFFESDGPAKVKDAHERLYEAGADEPDPPFLYTMGLDP